jgi:hypothetical protein
MGDRRISTAQPLQLRAGLLHTTLYDGRLGAIHWHGPQGLIEAWHGLHWLLRDPHWRTPELRLRPPVQEQVAGGWRVSLQGCFGPDPAGSAELPAPAVATLDTALVLEGAEDGVLTLTGQAALAPGAPPRAINRIGLCLLHPLAAAGARVEVVHDDGRRTRSALPRGVSPWPPFTGIRSLRVALAPGWWAVADFEGENFEIEDQRNNADASFKTYARSNFLPRPVLLEPGAVVRQSVRLRVERLGRVVMAQRACAGPVVPLDGARVDADKVANKAAAQAADPSGALVALDLNRLRADEPRAFALGLEIEPADLQQPLGAARSQARALQPDRLHLEWDPLTPMTPRQAAVLAALLEGASAALRLDLRHLDDPSRRAALRALAARLRAAGIVPVAVAAFPTSVAAVDAARAAFAGAAVGGGTADFFVQLNRMDRLPPLDFLSFTVCPTVHQADDRTVLDSARALPGMLAMLQHRHPGVPVHVGPSRIAARRSPLGALAVSDAGMPMPLAGHDARDGTGFGVVWAAAHLAGLAAAGAAGATVLRWADCGTDSAGAAFWGTLSARRDRCRLQSLNTGHPAVTAWRWAVQSEAGCQHEDWLVHTGDAACGVVGMPMDTGPLRRGLALSLQTFVQAGADAAGIPARIPPASGEGALPPRSLTRMRWAC